MQCYNIEMSNKAHTVRTILEYILAWQIWSIELAASLVFVHVVARITETT